MQMIVDFIERNYLQTDFSLIERDTQNKYSEKRYSLYYRGNLIESFLIEKGQESLCETEAYQYMLGYLDSYIKFVIDA